MTSWTWLFLLMLAMVTGCSSDNGDDDDEAPDDDALDDDAIDDDADDDSSDDDSADDDTTDDDTTDDDTIDDDTVDDDTSDDDAVDDDSVDDDTSDDDAVDDDSVDDDSADDDTVFPVFCYPDADWDGHGDDLPGSEFDEPCPPGWAPANDDCDDGNPLVWPGAPELPGDGIVQNCGGVDLVPGDNSGFFVSKSGNDTNPGTMAAPKLTVAAAVAAAESADKVVYVSTGIYQESVSTSVSIFGGFDPVDWSRDVAAHDTLIVAAAVHEDYNVAVTVNAAAPVALDTLGCHGGEGGENTAGVMIQGGMVEVVDGWIYGGANDPVTTQMNGTNGIYAQAGLVIVSGGIVNGGWATDVCHAFASGIRSDEDSRLVLWDSDIDGGFARPAPSSGDCSTYGVRAEGTAFLHHNHIFGGDAQSAGYAYSSGATIYFAESLLTANTIEGGRADSSYTGESLCSMSGGAAAMGPTTWFGNSISGGHASGLDEVWAVGAAPAGTSLLVNNFIRAGEADSDAYPHSDGLQVDDAILVNNVIVFSSGEFTGTGVSIYGASIMVNNSVVGESNPDSLGLYANHEFVLVNNFIVNGVHLANDWYNFPVVMQNNDIWGADLECLIDHSVSSCVETADEINACAWKGCESAAGNISVDPLFVDAANGDYHLTAESDCIDAGVDPATWYDGDLADYDFDGVARPQGDGWDIGAFEYMN